MTPTVFALKLHLLVEEALEAGLPLGEVADALSIAREVLEDRLPVPSWTEDDGPY